MTTETIPSVRARGQARAYAAAIFFVLLTIGSAAMTVMAPSHRPASEHQLLQADLSEVIAQRKARIAELEKMIAGRCDRFEAPELVKLLVLDGRWADARRVGNGYETRCGEDPNVRRWVNAPVPRIVAIK